jgi:hypothetical protein
LGEQNRISSPCFKQDEHFDSVSFLHTQQAGDEVEFMSTRCRSGKGSARGEGEGAVTEAQETGKIKKRKRRSPATSPPTNMRMCHPVLFRAPLHLRYSREVTRMRLTMVDSAMIDYACGGTLSRGRDISVKGRGTNLGVARGARRDQILVIECCG